MFIIWLIMVTVVGTGFIFGTLIEDTFYLTIVFIILSIFIFMFTLLRKYTRFFFILLMSFIIRLSFLFINMYDVFQLPHSGDDTENFYKTGLLISEHTFLMNEEVYGGLYSKVLGVIFYLYGDDRLFVQFLNILIMMTAIIVTIEIFRKLNIPVKLQMFLVILMAFFPHSLIFSSILLRESLISLLITLSLYFFIKWFKGGKVLDSGLTIVFLVIAAAFHSAVISIIIGYAYGFIFYNPKTEQLNLSFKSLVPFTAFALIFIYVMIFPEIIQEWPLFNKFEQVWDENNNVYEIITASSGDMAYLTSIEINNVFELFIFAPIKVLYFITSPMPWSFRNLSDVLSFMLDGLFYLTVLILIIKRFNMIRKHPLLFILLLSIAAGWSVFGLGISNAGTAIRHRFKFFYIIIVFLSLLFTKKNK